MKTLSCDCGKTVKVGENAVAVKCCSCLNKSQSFDEDEAKTSPENAPAPKAKHAPKQVVPAKQNTIEIVSKTETEVTGKINGEDFHAVLEMGVDKKMHWKVKNETVSRGQRIAIARKINEQ